MQEPSGFQLRASCSFGESMHNYSVDGVWWGPNSDGKAELPGDVCVPSRSSIIPNSSCIVEYIIVDDQKNDSEEKEHDTATEGFLHRDSARVPCSCSSGHSWLYD